MIRITSVFLNSFLFNCKNDSFCRDHPDQVVEWLVCTECQLRFPDEFALKNHSYHVHPTKKRGRKRNKRVDVSVLCQFCAQVLPNQEVRKAPFINYIIPIWIIIPSIKPLGSNPDAPALPAPSSLCIT